MHRPGRPPPRRRQRPRLRREGDGTTDDTAAIEKAWQFVATLPSPCYFGKGPSPRELHGCQRARLYFPPGVYVYKGQA